MKYIIKESQKGKVFDFIKNYIDDNFTAKDDFGNKLNWRIIHSILKNTRDGEVFLFFGENEDNEYMTYYNCKYVEDWDLNLECPHLALQPKDYNKLDSMFGNAWKPIMMDWFKSNTGFEIKDIYIFE